MNQYTIYCTEEQTKKALKLGAPIITFEVEREALEGTYKHEGVMYFQPSAEQLLNWLDFKGVICEIYYRGKWYYDVQGLGNNVSFSSRREATLAAIDTALEYLINNK